MLALEYEDVYIYQPAGAGGQTAETSFMKLLRETVFVNTCVDPRQAAAELATRDAASRGEHKGSETGYWLEEGKEELEGGGGAGRGGGAASAGRGGGEMGWAGAEGGRRLTEDMLETEGGGEGGEKEGAGGGVRGGGVGTGGGGGGEGGGAREHSETGRGCEGGRGTRDGQGKDQDQENDRFVLKQTEHRGPEPWNGDNDRPWSGDDDRRKIGPQSTATTIIAITPLDTNGDGQSIEEMLQDPSRAYGGQAQDEEANEQGVGVATSPLIAIGGNEHDDGSGSIAGCRNSSSSNGPINSSGKEGRREEGFTPETKGRQNRSSSSRSSSGRVVLVDGSESGGFQSGLPRAFAGSSDGGDGRGGGDEDVDDTITTSIAAARPKATSSAAVGDIETGGAIVV